VQLTRSFHGSAWFTTLELIYEVVRPGKAGFKLCFQMQLVHYSPQFQTPNIFLLLGIGAFVSMFRLVKPFLFPGKMAVEAREEEVGFGATNLDDGGWCTGSHVLENAVEWLVGLHSLPGVRLVTWTILAVINWMCFDCKIT
jgi:hypothetical protein